MTRTYGKVLSSLWVSSRKWRALGNDDQARLLYVYLQSCPHGNNVGCFVLPTGYVMADLGWSADAITQALDRLRAVSLVEWNEAESVVRLVNAIEKDPPTNPSHAAAMFKTAHSLPDCPEKLDCLRDLAMVRQAAKVEGLREAIDTLSTACEQGARPNLTLTEPNPNPAQPIEGGECGTGARAPDPSPPAAPAGCAAPKWDGFAVWELWQERRTANGHATSPNPPSPAETATGQRWIDAGASRALIVQAFDAALGRKGAEPPRSLRYCNGPIQDALAVKRDPLEVPAYLRRGTLPPSEADIAATRLNTYRTIGVWLDDWGARPAETPQLEGAAP